ncbi:hypothetical protein BJ138DRAFT_984205, partial [Hygrophoropsis aurantiaca]
MMRSHRCAISGSLALYFFDPARNWIPADMDLYVPKNRKNRVLRYLLCTGYNPVNISSNRSSYKLECGMDKVITMCNGDVNIDVIITSGRNSIAPITHFHLTAVMNFLSADGFFSAYPNLTADGRALCNPLQFYHHQPRSLTAYCYQKYALRRYDIRINP